MLNKYLSYIQESIPENIIIEELKDSDVKQLIPIMNRFNKSTRDSSFFKYPDSAFENRFSSILSVKHIILVAKDNEKIIALLTGITKPSPIGYIHMVYVDKPYRGTGLAETMFKQIMDWFKVNNRPVVSIGVMGKNERARNFYKKMGFIEDSIKMRNIDSKNITYKIEGR